MISKETGETLTRPEVTLAEHRQEHTFGTALRHEGAAVWAMCAVLVLLCTAIAAVSDAAEAVQQTLEFDIARKGDIVGHHRISFRQEGDTLVVHSEIKIEVKVLFVTVYRYQQTREEIWRGGKLIALTSRADDDGTLHDIKGHAGPDRLSMSSGKHRWTLPSDSVQASFRNVSMVTEKGPLADSLTGRILHIPIVKLGEKTSAPAAGTS